MRAVALEAAQELIGHATIDMTMRYAHLSQEVGRRSRGTAELWTFRPSGREW